MGQGDYESRRDTSWRHRDQIVPKDWKLEVEGHFVQESKVHDVYVSLKILDFLLFLIYSVSGYCSIESQTEWVSVGNGLLNIDGLYLPSTSLPYVT